MRWNCRERMEQKSVWEAKAAEVLAGLGPRRIIRKTLEALLADAAEVPTLPSSAGCLILTLHATIRSKCGFGKSGMRNIGAAWAKLSSLRLRVEQQHCNIT